MIDTVTNVDLEETLSDLQPAPAPPVANESPSSKSNKHGANDQTQKAGIMIIDDESYNVLVVRKFLQHAGYENFVTTTESPQAIDLMKRDLPDIVLLDIMMPEVSGIDILRVMKITPELSTIPVIILTASPDPALKTQALELGATDFLAKPVDPGELILRVKNVLAAKANFDLLAKYSVDLERQVAARTRELELSRRHIIFCLARASEFRDNDTGHHVIRVGKYAGAIARELGYSLRPRHLNRQHSFTMSEKLAFPTRFFTSLESLIRKSMNSSRSTSVMANKSLSVCQKANGRI